MIPLPIEPSIFTATLVLGFFTEVIAAEKVNKAITLLIGGQWLIVAGIVGWGWLNFHGMSLALLLIGAPQCSRIIRRFIAWLFVKDEVDNAARPYLSEYCR